MKYQRYPKYKDGGIEWIGEIPEHWDVTRARWLFREINERSTNGDETLLSVSEYYGVKPRKDVIDPGDFITNAASLEGYKKCQKNDLVMNIMLAWKGALGITDYDGIVSPSYNVYRPLKPKDAKYFHYLFRTKVYADIFRNNSTGIIDSRLRLYPDSFASVKVIRPPLEDQISICKFLDVQLRRVEELTLSHEKMIRLLKEKRQAIITNAVSKGLDPNVPMKDSGVEWIGEIPEHWDTIPIKFIMSCNDETLPESTHPETKIQYIEISDVSENQGITSIQEIKFSDAPSRARRIVKDGDIIISTVRTYLRAIATIKEPRENTVVSTGFAVLRPRGLSQKFAKYALSANYFIERIVSESTGVSYPAISSEKLMNFRIAIPDSKSQNYISDYIDKINGKLSQLILKQERMIELLKEYKTSLISQAVTGKIDVRGFTLPTTSSDA